MTKPLLFQSTRIGDINVANRIVMAPLTRSRADEGNGDIPGGPMNVDYYRQRSGAGLIISEGTQISPVGKGYIATPGIYSDTQVQGWKKSPRLFTTLAQKSLRKFGMWVVSHTQRSQVVPNPLPLQPFNLK